jgi:hypothetical protein
VALDSQSAALRISVEPGPIWVGAFAESRAVQTMIPGPIRHFGTAGLDAVFDRVFDGHGLRAWAELFAGLSWYDENPADSRNPTFMGGRAILAWRIGGMRRAEPYFELYGFGGLLDPSTRVGSDLMSELKVGVNLGFWRYVRIGLEGEARRVSRNTPAFREVFTDADALLLQLATDF